MLVEKHSLCQSEHQLWCPVSEISHKKEAIAIIFYCGIFVQTCNCKVQQLNLVVLRGHQNEGKHAGVRVE